jgi:hypothetical protein
MAESNKEQKFPAEHILSLNSCAGHSTLLENEEEEHGSQLQQSVCLSQCNVTQIENLLACRISYERFSECKSREQALKQSAKPSAATACHVFRSADFKANRARRSPAHSVLIPSPPALRPLSLSLTHTRLFSLPSELHHVYHTVRWMIALTVLSTETVNTSPRFSH